MPVFNNILAGAAGSGGAGYKVERSLRFNNDDGAHMLRTPSSGGSRTTWTVSFWVKRCSQDSNGHEILSAGTSTNDYFALRFNSSDKLEIFDRPSYGNIGQITTTAMYRDFSAWMHVCYVWNTTVSTAADRRKLYVNGIRVTQYDTNSTPNQNHESRWNSSGRQQAIGRFNPSNTLKLDAYLAEMHFVDGIIAGS